MAKMVQLSFLLLAFIIIIVPFQSPSGMTMAYTTQTTTNKTTRPSWTKKNWTKNTPAYYYYYYYTSYISSSRLLLATTNTPETSSRKSQRIVICGGGIGGLSTAFDARRHWRPDDDDDDTTTTITVTVVSDREQFQFTPSNPWVAVRKRTAADISISLRETLGKHQIDFIHGKINALDPQLQHLVLDDGTKVPYDYLVIATGPRLAFDEIPGAARGGGGGSSSSTVDEHHHQFLVTTSICTTPHAVHAAASFDRLVENPGPVVVGAVQSASCFGPAYEYAMLLQHELKKRGGNKLVEQCPIHFITPEPYIGHLGLNGAGDSQRVLEDMLEKRNIKFTTNCKVKHVHPDSVAIQYFDQNDRTIDAVLPSHLTMLIPPFRGIDAWKSVPGLTDDRGMILVDKHQQSRAYPNIFGVGVCVHLDPLGETKVSVGMPKTGYMIESMGTAAVKNIRDMIRLEATKGEGVAIPELHHVPLLHGLCITDFGDEGAVFVTMPQIPPRKFDVTITGKIGTLAKIAFEKYFLHKIETGDTDPYYEKCALGLVGIHRTSIV